MARFLGLEPVRVLVVMGRGFSPLQATCTPAFGGKRPSPPRSPGPYTGASALSSSEKAATLGTPSHLACLKSWTGRRCPTSWTDVRCRFFSRLHSTPWSRTNSNSWRVSSSRFGLKLYRDITRSLPTCGNTYKQKLVRGSVPSSREE